MNTIIHKAIHAWLSWRRQKALYRAYPGLRRLDETEAMARRAHKPVSHIRAAKRDAMTSLLAGKNGRAN